MTGIKNTPPILKCNEATTKQRKKGGKIKRKQNPIKQKLQKPNQKQTPFNEFQIRILLNTLKLKKSFSVPLCVLKVCTMIYLKGIRQKDKWNLSERLEIGLSNLQTLQQNNSINQVQKTNTYIKNSSRISLWLC